VFFWISIIEKFFYEALHFLTLIIFAKTKEMKQIVSILFCIISIYGFSQDEKENEYNWGCSITLNGVNSQIAHYGNNSSGLDSDGNLTAVGDKNNGSYSFGLSVRYKIRKNWLARLECDLTRLDVYGSNKTKSVPSSSVVYTEDNVTQGIMRYLGVIQFNFFHNDRFETYGGFSFQFIRYSTLSRNFYTERRDEITDSIISWNRSQIEIPGGNAFGLGIHMGFNVFLHKNLGIGAEFSNAYLFYNVGGSSTEEYTFQYKPSPQDKVTNTFNESYKGWKFSKILPALNVSLFF
jgi:hypothetical protein